MNPLQAILVELALKELAILIPELGEVLVAGIAALVTRLRGSNPGVNTIVADAGALAMETVQAMEHLDWGHFFSQGDEINTLKAKAALNDLLGKVQDRGLTLAQNDAEMLIRSAVEVLRTKVVDAISEPDAPLPPDSSRQGG